jgi:hypothetical protein
MMKIVILVFTLLLSLSSLASRPEQMICTDTQFGAGHFKMVLSDISPFFYPYNTPNPREEQRPILAGDFWIKGVMYQGVIEKPLFMPDWEANSGWYKSSPSIFDISLCNWKKCPVRKIKLMIHTKNQSTAEGTINFLLQVNNGERVNFEKKVNCEIK